MPPPGEQHAEADQDAEDERGRGDGDRGRAAGAAVVCGATGGSPAAGVATVGAAAVARAAGCSAWANCATVANRSAGHRRQRPLGSPASTASGTLGRTCAHARRGLAVSRLAMIACAVGPGERRLPGQHLVEHRGQAVDVGAGVEPAVAGRLLRAHVGRRADREAGLGQPLVAARASARAMPKSATSVWPSRVSRMFSGLMSRWITPCSWA